MISARSGAGSAVVGQDLLGKLDDAVGQREDEEAVHFVGHRGRTARPETAGQDGGRDGDVWVKRDALSVRVTPEAWFGA